MRRIGIDVGGTNTDAVLVDGGTVRHAVKAATTREVGAGIVAVMKQLVAESGIDANRIDAVMIGTTHFTNAVVQRRDVGRIAAVRIAAMRVRLRRWMIALTKCVVPITTPSIRPRATSG